MPRVYKRTRHASANSSCSASATAWLDEDSWRCDGNSRDFDEITMGGLGRGRNDMNALADIIVAHQIWRIQSHCIVESVHLIQRSSYRLIGSQVILNWKME